MILGLFLYRLELPVIPLIIMILSGLVLIGGFAFMIFRHVYEKGESDIDPALFKKISVISAYVFIIYAVIELLAACACVVVNDACRYGYHFDLSKNGSTGHLCKFCYGFKDRDNHSFASDAVMLGLYFDAFIVNAFVTNTVKVVREKLASLHKS